MIYSKPLVGHFIVNDTECKYNHQSLINKRVLWMIAIGIERSE